MKKELLYICIIIFIVFAIIGYPDLEMFQGDSTLDLNIHDMYIVIPSASYILFILALISSIVYFIRVLFTKFKNRTVNYIYLVTNGLLLLLFTILIIFAASILSLHEKTEELTEFYANEIAGINEDTTNILYLLFSFQMITVILQTIVALKTKNQKTDASTI
jgi:hypothetical protein